MPNFSKDIDDSETRYEASRAFHRTEQLVIKDDSTVYVRLISDEVIPADTHSFIETKPKPDDCTWSNWPAKFWGICPQDVAFRLADEAGNLTDRFEDGYGDCYIHKAYAGIKDPKFDIPVAKPQQVSYGLGVVRKPQYDPVTKKAVGFADETFEFTDDTGTVHTIPKIVIVAMRYDRFWQSAKATAFLPPHTICDKDFAISRKGSKYTVTPYPGTPDLAPGTANWARYEKAVALTGINVVEYLSEHASRDHYAKFFIPGETPKGGYGGKKDDSGSEDQAAAASADPVIPDVSPDDMAAFSAKFDRRGSEPAAAAAAES